MLRLIIGGSASGKSEYAERLVCSLPGKRIYAATMEPFGEEGRERIARHRKLREGRGFVTVEVPRELGVLADTLRKSRAQGKLFGEELDTEDVREELKTGSVRKIFNILLEDLPNLVANELFADGEIIGTDAERAEKSDVIFSKVIRAVEELSCISENLTIVTGDIFSDGVRYDSATEEYRRLLAKINCRTAEEADQVVFVAAGCPVETDVRHGDDPCIKEKNTGTVPADFWQKSLHSERKSGMIFVTGPLASGKRAWVKEKLGICEENIVRAAEILRECPTEGVLQENNVQKSRNLKSAKSEAACVTDVQELVGKSSMTEEELEALAERLSEYRAVIACEVGGGVIPLDRGERIWRENAGRLACLLADRAAQVILVHCGIGICIKTPGPKEH